MNLSIYSFKNYRVFLDQYLKAHPKKGHGLRSVWAHAMGCQVAFVSHVLKGLYNLNIEQAECLARHLALDQEETEYFILLIQKERAGTHQLKKFYSQLIQKKSEQRDNIRERVKIKENLSLEDQTIYYSQWLYSAVRILLTIPEFQTSPEKIATYFNTPLATIRQILDFLETRQIISLKNGQYQTQNTELFLDKKSPLYPHQQSYWRQKAVESIYKNNREDIHFTLLFTVADNDIKKVKDVLLKAIEDSSEIIRPSKEEKLYSISMDMFEVR